MSYSLSGADAASFAIGADGAITVRSGTILDHETKASWRATRSPPRSPTGKDADRAAENDLVIDGTIAVTVEVPNVEEPPGAPTHVAAQAASRTSMSVSWTAPSDTGALPVATHDLRRFAGTADPARTQEAMWTVVADVGAGTSATIDRLEPNADYRVQVRAVGDGAGPWSVSAAGRTGKAGPLTAEFRNVPAEHDGSRPFSCEIVFSEEFHGLELAAFAEGARFGSATGVWWTRSARPPARIAWWRCACAPPAARRPQR